MRTGPRQTIGLQLLGEQVADVVVRAQRLAAAKAAANAEIEEARARFCKDCVSGIRGSQAENEFSELLLEKNIYFLSLYASEGMTLRL